MGGAPKAIVAVVGPASLNGVERGQFEREGVL